MPSMPWSIFQPLSKPFCSLLWPGASHLPSYAARPLALPSLSRLRRLFSFRSLGWRARFVATLRPVPLEITVDHPLLTVAPSFLSTSANAKPPARPSRKNLADVLPALLRVMHDCALANCKHEEKRPSEQEAGLGIASDGEFSQTHAAQHDGDGLFTWVEVLCGGENRSEKHGTVPPEPVARWVAIQPAQEGFDEPEEVESMAAWMDTDESSRAGPEATSHKQRGRARLRGASPRRTTRPRRSPVSYVLAVEHVPPTVDRPVDDRDKGDAVMRGARLTDVTPRYANAWSRTLRLRGATGKEITAGGGRCVDEWWETSLARVNRLCCPGRARIATPRKPPVRAVTKSTTKDGRAVDLVELASSGDEEHIQPDGSESDEHDTAEARELASGLESEQIPTSKQGFRRSPFYVVASVLNSRDVLHPDAHKRISGVFKGELGEMPLPGMLCRC